MIGVGAVVLRDGKEVGDADECEEKVAGEPGNDRLGRHAGRQGADEECADEGEHAHVDRQRRRDDKHHNERIDGYQVGRHEEGSG